MQTRIKPQTIVSLDAADCLESNNVGAKAARLSKMVLNGFPVPKAFVLTVAAFENYCEHNKIKPDSKLHSYKERSQHILNGSFPKTLSVAIEDHVRKMDVDLLAVRSSSVSEDGHQHSMAGQYHTFLNVSKQDIAQKIKACWAGVFNSSVIAYSKKNHLQIGSNMGVIIQQQVEPVCSGVLFTLDPQIKSTDHFVIEWVEGLGEKLVSGSVTPQRIHVNRNSLQIYGDTDLKLEPFLKRMIDYAIMAEEDFNCPIDMEWCVDSDLHILQARPVTALIKPDSTIWTNVNMAENFPQPLSPFTWSIVDRFYTAYMTNILRMFGWSDKDLKSLKPIVNNLTGIQDGRIYYNLTNWYEVLYFSPIGKYLKTFLDNYIGQKVPVNFSSKHRGEQGPINWKNPLKHLQFWSKLLYIHITSKKHLNEFETQFHIHRKKWRKTPYEEQGLTELIENIERIYVEFVDKYYYNQGIADISVLIFPGILTQIIRKWFHEYKSNSDAAIVQLFQGLDIKSTEPVKIISEVADQVESIDRLQQLLISKNYTELEQNLGEDTKIHLQRFMSHFGARCYNECMIVSPTFEERHDLFWSLVEKYQLASNLREKTKVLGKSKNQKPFNQKMENKLSFFKRVVFRTILKNSHKAIGLREQGRLIRSLLFGEIRLITLEIGQHLKNKEYLKKRDDIFCLQLEEIKQIAYGKFQFPETIPELINQREQAFKKCQDQNPPELFISESGNYSKHRNDYIAGLNTSALKGTGVSAGTVTATARIILDPITDERLKPGDILVTRSTDPGWTPLFVIAGGLVLERGGLLSHGAIVSREFSIPAVVGIENATQRIKDGDTIKVNGMSGEIEIIKN